MRKQLQELINKTIFFEYELPDSNKGIQKTIFSNKNDHCYSNAGNNQLSELVYSSIIDYAFNEYDLSSKDYDSLYIMALDTKIRIDKNKSVKDQKRYGFFGEVLLYCMLYCFYKVPPLISRGYFYNPTGKSETTGYDSYHIIEHNNQVELWFGEVKFHEGYTGAVNDVILKLEKSISEEYLNTNLFALPNHQRNFNLSGTKIESIIKDWQDNPRIKIIDHAKKYNMKLVYPVLLLFDESKKGYDQSIKNVISYIEKNHKDNVFEIPGHVSIFFIIAPVGSTSEIKTTVLEWIKSKKQIAS